MTTLQPDSEHSLEPGRSVRSPVMRVNAYDRVSAGMMSIVLALGVVLALVFVWWGSTLPPKQEILVPMEMVGGRGGVVDGELGDSLLVESPDDAQDNASTTEADVADVAIDTSLDVLESQASDAAAAVADFGTNAMSANIATPGSVITGGKSGRSDGTGNRRGLGQGPGSGGGGVSNEERWFIRYADESSLDEYARQLDFFGVELGVLLPDGQLVYLGHLSDAVPQKRNVTSGKNEHRLYMTWQGGSRKTADLKLFEKAGINASSGMLFHFYPEKTERLLLKLEYEFAHRRVLEIARTYFAVIPEGKGYTFAVVRQTAIR